MNLATWELLSYVVTVVGLPQAIVEFLLQQRKRVIFSMLISLFERAYMLLYNDNAPADKQRRWNSWEDYMREWCAREDFRDALDALLAGEDPDFCAYIRALAEKA